MLVKAFQEFFNRLSLDSFPPKDREGARQHTLVGEAALESLVQIVRQLVLIILGESNYGLPPFEQVQVDSNFTA